MGKLRHRKFKSSSSSPSPLPVRKRLFPLEIQRFAAKKGSQGRVRASAGKRQGASREEPGDTESLAQRWQSLPKFHPRSPDSGCCRHTEGDRFERGRVQGLSSHLHRGQTAGAGERGPGCSPLGRKSSSLSRLGFRLRIAQARLEPGARSKNPHGSRESRGEERPWSLRWSGERLSIYRSWAHPCCKPG